MRYLESIATHPKLSALVASLEDGERQGLGSEFDCWNAVVNWYGQNYHILGRVTKDLLETLGSTFEQFTTWRGGKLYRGIGYEGAHEFLDFLAGKDTLFDRRRPFESWSRSHEVSSGYGRSQLAGIVASKRVDPKNIMIDFTDPLVRAWIARMKVISPHNYQGRFKGADREVVTYGVHIRISDVSRLQLNLNVAREAMYIHDLKEVILELSTDRDTVESLDQAFDDFIEGGGYLTLSLHMKNGKITGYQEIW